jgi:hypothetical protein
MNPLSQEILGQIVNPEGPAAASAGAAAPASTFTIAQILSPTGPARDGEGYTGPERRAPQVIVAEDAAEVAPEADLPAR